VNLQLNYHAQAQIKYPNVHDNACPSSTIMLQYSSANLTAAYYHKNHTRTKFFQFCYQISEVILQNKPYHFQTKKLYYFLRVDG